MNQSDTKNDISSEEIQSLVETLKNEDGIVRQNARIALVDIGEPALDALINAFEIKEDPLHWEVAKALSQIGTSRAARTLIDALEDKEFSVRWMAAEGLIHIGSDGVLPMLQALRKKSDSVWLREGCHHVIHDLLHKKLVNAETQESLLPVLKALNHIDTEVRTNSAANTALKMLNKKE